MCEKLECCEISLLALNSELRIDAEYFSKLNLEMQRLIQENEYFTIDEIAEVTDGIHTSIDYDDTSKINLISAQSPKENFFDLSRNAYISKHAHEKNPRTALQENDVILSIVGTIGNCAVVDSDILPANSDRHVGIIRLNSSIKPSVLSTFLLTKFGKNQTIRETTGSVQKHLFLYKIKEIKVPKFGLAFQEEIDVLVKTAKQMLKTSQTLFLQAEQLLTNEIGINIDEIDTGAVQIKSFSDTFAKTGRLDAEYYQGKYDEFYNSINKNNETVKIADCFNLVSTKIDKNQPFYKYVEIGNIDISQGTILSNTLSSEDLPANAKITTRKNDVLVSKVRPSRGAVAIVYEDKLIASGAFAVLRAKSTYRPTTIQTLLRTKLYKQWLLRFNVGTSYPIIKNQDVLDLPIPNFSEHIQEQVFNLVNKANNKIFQSKQLFETAKKAVEIAIEQSEDEAIDLLKNC